MLLPTWELKSSGDVAKDSHIQLRFLRFEQSGATGRRAATTFPRNAPLQHAATRRKAQVRDGKHVHEFNLKVPNRSWAVGCCWVLGKGM